MMFPKHTEGAPGPSQLGTGDVTDLAHVTIDATIGQRVSEWNGTTRAQLKGKYYWGAMPVAFYTVAANGSTGAHFEHQDWMGTERLRTAYNGGVEGTFTSLPWGDSQSSTGSDANHYAMLDHDNESDTDHAQFRQYSNTLGRWLSPDPYGGSYDASNPQSFNRYVYAMNSPLSGVDPSGLDWQYNRGTGCWDYGWFSEDGQYAGVIESGFCSGGGDGGSYPTGDDSGIVSSSGNGGGNGGGGASNNYVSNYPDYSPVFCAGDALKAKGLSIGLDAVGLIPGLGNAASAASAVASIFEDNPTGAATSGVDVGLKLANASLGGTKAIPIIGNIFSLGVGAYDLYQAGQAYQSCMASGKYN